MPLVRAGRSVSTWAQTHWPGCAALTLHHLETDSVSLTPSFSAFLSLTHLGTELNAQQPTYYNNRAAALLMLQQPKQALEDANSAMALDPQNPKVRAAGAGGFAESKQQ